MFTLRRRAWIRWLPPMESASPSPVTTQTDRSPRAVAMPVAIEKQLEAVPASSSSSTQVQVNA